jgi:nitric oxide reductase activation protein
MALLLEKCSSKSLSKYILITYYLPDTICSTRNIPVNNEEKKMSHFSTGASKNRREGEGDEKERREEERKE